MAALKEKHMGKGYGGINTPYDDCIVPTPKAKSNDWGADMGSPITDAKPATPIAVDEVQFASIKGGEAGSKGFGPGKK